MKNRTVSIAIIVALSALSCEKNNLGTIDASKEVPQLSLAAVTPDSIYLDSLSPTSGQYQIRATVRVNASASFSVQQSVVASIVRPNSSTVLKHIVLPLTAGNTYSGEVQFTVSRAQAGLYRVQISSKTSEGLLSNSIELPFTLGRRNALPHLLAVTIPDSISAPSSSADTIKVQFTAAVSDSDGLADIREVTFRRISPPDPTKFFMKDDGSLEPPVGIGGIPLRSGDNIAGDGQYSFLIPVLSSTTRRMNVFQFQCVDSFGDTSRSIVDSLAIR